MSITDISALKRKYKGLTKKHEATDSDRGKGFWKPETGQTRIRIVPYKYDKSNPFVEILKYFNFNGKYFVSPASYGGEDCILEAAERIKEGRTREDYKIYNKMAPKIRILANIVVRGEENEGSKLWEFSEKVFEEILKYATDQDYGDIFDPVEGKDIIVTFTPKNPPEQKFPKTDILVKPNSTPISEDAEVLKNILATQKKIEEALEPATKEFLEEQLEIYLNPEKQDKTRNKKKVVDDDKVETTDTVISDFEALLKEEA